jgi:NaMN:DMB phosphoribosyltransferase
VTAWLTSLRDRPIAESERRSAMAAVAVLLTATALLLALTCPGRQRQGTTERPSHRLARSAAAVHAQAPEISTAPLTPTVARTARRFLAGYLAYLYGHTPASQIKGATPAFVHSLEDHLPRASPGMRSQEGRLVSLHTTPARSGLLGVSALVTDGGVIDYPIGLLLASRGGRLLVTGVDGA